MKSYPLNTNSIVHAQFLMNFPLAQGDYSFSLGIADKEIGQGLYEDYHLMLHDLKIIHVLSNKNAIGFSGIYNMKPSLTIIED
jgi:hypothetical protein